jgi:hypothetical protein
VLLLQWLDETAAMSRIVCLTVYVDDTSIEAVGPDLAVKRTVVEATKHFTSSLQSIGMEFSPTKNNCLASSPRLAHSIIQSLRGLRAEVVQRAKSLGGALGAGRRRNTQVQQRRLQAFKVRKKHFQKLRRSVGARRSQLVLRTGGTAALVYGQANTGVSDSMLLSQRRAVAASFVPGGAGDLDLTLILADDGHRGRADPAFAAHSDPIGMWAGAVWCSWFPRDDLQLLAGQALQRILGMESPWSRVVGPATAFVASARRLGWVVRDAVHVFTDQRLAIDLTRDSPAFVRQQVALSVSRWRWREVEKRIPALRSGTGGLGALMQPIFRLLHSKPGEYWGHKEQGALRSAFTNTQWTQCRLQGAGLASSKNCRLCVQFGFCTEEDTSTAYHGTLLHRIWTCPVTESIRREKVPMWLYTRVKQAIRPDGTMAAADLALYTRALVASPVALLDPLPNTESFEWVQQPSDGVVSGTVYVDGSRIDGDSAFAGLCARQGWAFAAYDEEGALLAAAKGRPPPWADGIFGAELWGLFMATMSADPWAPFRVDCLSVQQGTQKGQVWAAAPERRYARIWAPLNAALDDDPGRVVWMPAHCSKSAVGHKQLGNGEALTALDLAGNAFVDRLAKEAARADRLPQEQRDTVRKLDEIVTNVA